jgi:hypothetical protein
MVRSGYEGWLKEVAKPNAAALAEKKLHITRKVWPSVEFPK